jgi:NAD(P)-dependent dehydrogenase (short-subunit alcohol dehydrogenase family)
MQDTHETTTPQPCALVVGVGELEGIGGAVAARFAREGLHVYVVGRTRAKLESVVAHIQAQGGQATALVCGLESEEVIEALFSRILKDGRQLEASIYNAAYLNAPRRFLSTPRSFIEGNWRITCLAGILAGQAAARQMLSHGRGTIIYTGATASLRGKPLFAAFASAKAALRAFARALAMELAPQGIHVVHVVIDGVVDGQRGKRAMAGLGRLLVGLVKRRNGALDPAQVAENYFQLYQQAPGAWSHELELRPFKEPF